MFGSLGSGKAFAKKELRWLPIIGWAFTFGDFIFLSRDWQKDKDCIRPALDKNFKSKIPCQILILPEGTRYTEKKHEASKIFAQENNLPIFKHHLTPRLKGLTYILRHLRANYSAKDFSIYQVQLMQRKDSLDISIENLLKGERLMVDIYLDEISFDNLPNVDAKDEEYADFLYEIFKEKDQIMEDYLYYDFLPHEKYVLKKRSLFNFIRFLLVNGFALVSTIYILFLALNTESFIIRSMVYTTLVSIYVLIILIVSHTKNSKYGEKSKKGNEKSN